MSGKKAPLGCWLAGTAESRPGAAQPGGAGHEAAAWSLPPGGRYGSDVRWRRVEVLGH